MSSVTPKSFKPDPSSQKVIEIVAGLILATVSIALLFWIIPANVNHTVNQHDISPDFFPKAAAWTLLGLSVALIVNRTVKTPDLRKTITGSSGGIAIFAQLSVWLVIGAIAYAGMALLSFHITAVALIVGGALVCHYRKWGIIAAVAIISPVVIGQVTWLVFGVKFS